MASDTRNHTHLPRKRNFSKFYNDTTVYKIHRYYAKK